MSGEIVRYAVLSASRNELSAVKQSYEICKNLEEKIEIINNNIEHL